MRDYFINHYCLIVAIKYSFVFFIEHQGDRSITRIPEIYYKNTWEFIPCEKVMSITYVSRNRSKEKETC